MDSDEAIGACLTLGVMIWSTVPNHPYNEVEGDVALDSSAGVGNCLKWLLHSQTPPGTQKLLDLIAIPVDQFILTACRIIDILELPLAVRKMQVDLISDLGDVFGGFAKWDVDFLTHFATLPFFPSTAALLKADLSEEKRKPALFDFGRGMTTVPFYTHEVAQLWLSVFSSAAEHKTEIIGAQVLAYDGLLLLEAWSVTASETHIGICRSYLYLKSLASTRLIHPLYGQRCCSLA